MSNKKTPLFVLCCIATAGLYAPGAFAQANKVDVCHIPPGNPENAHTINISENAVQTHLDHGDYLGPCESEVIIEVDETVPPDPSTDPTPTITPTPTPIPVPTPHPDPTPTSSACACPRAGVWRVTNLDGWMECNMMGIKRKLTGADPNDGAIWILTDDCSTIFSEAYEKDREDVIMDVGRECMFFGVAPGEESGAEALFDGAYKLENEEFIVGEYYMEMSGSGVSCSGYRPFEIEFIEPLSERDYDKLKKKMQKQLDDAREKLEEHQEQIDRYLKETNGGKAFGGRYGQE